MTTSTVSVKNNNFNEITITGVILAIILAVVLAASNTYLALKIGMLTSASIPAAVLSMGILRLFKRSNILENNLVQTAASAGEAVAGGIVYTIPALIIIRYWSHFGYWENFAIAVMGGILGVLFSIPLRRVLVTSKELPFPEGRAIAEVLQAENRQRLGLREILLGGVVGGLLELAQNGFKIIASNAQAWFSAGNTLFGFGGGFSSALIGAGYLIGFNVGFSLLLGAVIAWGFVLPLLSWQIAAPIHNIQSALNLYGDKIHYIGIGAMLIAGLWTLLMLIKPFYESLQFSLRALGWKNFKTGFYTLPRTERDIPILYTVVSILIMLVLSFFLLQHLFNIPALLLPNTFSFFIILGSVLYILVIGFIAVVICGYFSGLVGVSASPGSAVVIASMLLAALIIRALINFHPGLLTQSQLLNASAMTIIIGAIITGSACIANDNIQDLKVGYIVGATPWKQQVMLLIGVIAAASVVPPIMNLLFNVYGIANVFPRSGMDPSLTLAAPPAAMMAGIVQGVFHHNLPWSLLSIGAGLIFVCIIANQILQRYGLKLSILGIAIGIYLPLASSIPLVIGAFFSLLTSQRLRALLKKTKAGGKLQLDQKHQRCLLLACGLVAGAALMDVVLAIPMGLAHSPDILAIMPANWSGIATALGMLSVVLLGVWFYQLANRQ